MFPTPQCLFSFRKLSKFQRFSFIEHQIQYDQNSNFESPGETPKSQAYTEVRHFETSSQ